MAKRIIAFLLVGLSLGGLFFIYSYKTNGGNFYEALVNSDEASPTTVPEEMTDATSQEGKESSFALAISNLKPGKTVKVSILNVSIPVFVVVYADDNSNFGERLGVSKYFAPGYYSDEQIELGKDVSAGQLLHIALYSDNGNKEFGDKSDILVREGQHTSVIRDVVVGE